MKSNLIPRLQVCHPQPVRQQHRRSRGVRHRQGPRVQHRPAGAAVNTKPVLMFEWHEDSCSHVSST